MEPNQDRGPESRGITLDAKLTTRRFAVLFGVGFIGILTLYPVALEQLHNMPLPPGTSLPVLAVASLLTPTILLAISVVIGLKTAPRLNLRSYLLDWVVHDIPVVPQLRRDVRTAVRWGLLAGVAIIIVQLGFSFVIPELAPQTGGATTGAILASIPLRFLYGGITEELLLRWGLMALIAFVLFAVIGRGRESISDHLMWSAIFISAVIFGIGHLPAASATYSLTPGVVAYIIAGNSVAGIIFGWMFWRRSLEAAMVSHASTHVVLVTATIAGLVAA